MHSINKVYWILVDIMFIVKMHKRLQATALFNRQLDGLDHASFIHIIFIEFLYSAPPPMHATLKYKVNNETLCYHESQRSEEEADDQSDVRPMAHHHAQALTVGKGLGFFPLALCHPTRRRIKIRQLTEISSMTLHLESLLVLCVRSYLC